MPQLLKGHDSQFEIPLPVDFRRNVENLRRNFVPCSHLRQGTVVFGVKMIEGQSKSWAGGGGDAVILFHIIYYTLGSWELGAGSPNSVSHQPQAAMSLMC
jgi:hypothetical protein